MPVGLYERFLLNVFVLMHVSIASAQSLEYAWYVEGPIDDEVSAAVADGVGGSFSTGFFRGLVDFDNGPGSVQLSSPGCVSTFVARHDGLGALQWVGSVGGTCDSHPKAIAADVSGNALVVGEFCSTGDFDPGPGAHTLYATPGAYNDVFMCKVDPTGNLIWARAFGPAQVNGLHIDGDGNVYLVGNAPTNVPVDLDPGPDTLSLLSGGQAVAYVSKFDSNGDLIWCRQFETSGLSSCLGFDVDVTSTGEVVFCGRFSGAVDFDPSPGQQLITSLGSYDAYVCKLDSLGGYLWVDRFGALSMQSALVISVDGSDRITIGGQFYGTVDFDPGAGVQLITAEAFSPNLDGFILQVDAAGSLQWVHSYGSGSASHVWISDFEYDAGTLFVSGGFQASIDFDPGIGIASLNSNAGTVFFLALDDYGSFLSVTQMGPATIFDIAKDTQGGLFVCGRHVGTFDADPGPGLSPHTSAGQLDGVLIRISLPTILDVPAIQNHSSHGVLIIPDDDVLRLETDARDMHIVVYDAVGRLEPFVLLERSPGCVRLDFSSLPSGVHIVTLYNDMERRTLVTMLSR